MPENTVKKTSTVLEAIILALLIHAVFLSVIYMSDEGLFFFSKSETKKDVDIEFIELTEELLELEKEEELSPIQKLLDKYKNVTSKENTETSSQVRNYSFNKDDVDDQVLQELLNMEKEEFEKLKKEGVIPEDLDQNDLDKEKNSDPKENTNNNKKNSTSSYSAATSNYNFSRNHEKKRDPAYKCISFGQIVVEIAVDRDGKVTSAKAISGDLDKTCLLEESENYALRWKFAAKSDAPRSEKGTITFTFLPQ